MVTVMCTFRAFKEAPTAIVMCKHSVLEGDLKATAKLEKWGLMTACYRLTIVCRWLCLPNFLCFWSCESWIPLCIFWYVSHDV